MINERRLAVSAQQTIKKNNSEHVDVEAFAQHAAECVADMDCIVVVFRQWTDTVGTPPGIIAPIKGSDDSLVLDCVQLEQAMVGKKTVIAPCTFDTKDEEIAAQTIVQQFSSFPGCCFFMMHLLNKKPTSANEVRSLMDCHRAMLSTGVDDVILDPNTCPNALRQTLALRRSAWEFTMQRMEETVQSEVQLMGDNAFSALEAQHKYLMWDSVPRALMPHFPRANNDLKESESDHSIGKYSFAGVIQSPSLSLVHAIHTSSSTQNVIKIVDKSRIFLPEEVERIFREYRFLSNILDHPNIVHCSDMLHTPQRLYLVLSFAGDENLAQLLSSQPGQRLDPEGSINCFQQLASGVAYCHKRQIVHRAINLEHVVLSQCSYGNRYHCCLVDFSTAMVSQLDTLSRVVCGTMPCIAPEVALEIPYVPWRADCWSAGVVLLEMAGGLSSLSLSVPFNIEAEPIDVADRIRNFFSAKGSHAAALAHMGDVRDPKITSVLELLLASMPANRSAMCECLSTLSDM